MGVEVYSSQKDQGSDCWAPSLAFWLLVSQCQDPGSVAYLCATTDFVGMDGRVIFQLMPPFEGFIQTHGSVGHVVTCLV